jgi:hypothetical protein
MGCFQVWYWAHRNTEYVYLDMSYIKRFRCFLTFLLLSDNYTTCIWSYWLYDW